MFIRWPLYGRRLATAALVALFFLSTAPPVNSGTTTRSVERKFQIVNESGSKVEVYWIHPHTKERSLMSDPHVVPGAEFKLDSFVGHEFEIRELPGKSGVCKATADQQCRMVVTAVSENDDQLSRVTKDFQVEFVDNKVKARQEATELLAECQAKAKAKVDQAGIDGSEAEALKAMDELLACVEKGVAETLERVNEEIAFQASVRTDIAGMLENYTCADINMTTTKDVKEETWMDPKDGAKLKTHIKHDRPSSKIHVIENFIREDECIAMEEAAAPRLHDATVADGQGGSRLSENRKAKQAGITVPWDKEEDGDPIARVSRRVYEYTNHVLGLGIQHNGQEDLMSIQYFGRGDNETAPDRYMPHCDGDCTGLPFMDGNRMATMVMYCTVADVGGHTNFRNAGVHVKPEKYSAVFFSYIDPDTKIMDTGFTEHSGCPVIEGEKKIVTQWIRLGVDDESPWDAFNTLGIKISDLEELEASY